MSRGHSPHGPIAVWVRVASDLLLAAALPTDAVALSASNPEEAPAGVAPGSPSTGIDGTRWPPAPDAR